MQTIEKVLNHARQIANGEHDTIRPGMPFTIPDSWQAGESVAQGDLIIEVTARKPIGYVLIEKPTEQDLQLVPGNTEGAKHCLDSFDGVQFYRHPDWNAESLDGPYFVTTEQRTITHPTHGHVHIPAGRKIRVSYQREWEAEQRRERRNQD